MWNVPLNDLTCHRSITVCASSNVSKISPFNSSSLSFPLNDSIYPFSHGLPVSIFGVFTPSLASHSRTVAAVNSGPVSDRVRPATQDGRRLRSYRRRWKVERLFAWLQNFRRLLVRHEYHAENFLGFFRLGCLVIRLRQF